MRVATLAIVGGGPRTVSLLERLAASYDELAGGVRWDIHVIDPYPVGGGRIWRRDQSSLLWMNSVAADITVFTDSSLTCVGPLVPGPTLAQWVFGEGAQWLERAGLSQDVRQLGSPDGFASRAIQGEYLAWAYQRVLAGLPEQVRVYEHREEAIEVAADLGGRRVNCGSAYAVLLASGAHIAADVVVLAQGHLDRSLTPDQHRLAERAHAAGLVYIPPGYTADLDLSGLAAAEPVIVQGFGLAFIDLMVLVAEGRGGLFESNEQGELTYLRSGREPVLHVGSRRGVPYHAKLGYAVPGAGPTAPRFLTLEALEQLALRTDTVDFVVEVRPLIAKELAAAHYRRLFAAHPHRVHGSWQRWESLLDEISVEDPRFVAGIATAVPDPQDRFELAHIDRPLRDYAATDRDQLESSIVSYIDADLARRADAAYSADHAVYHALLTVYAVLTEAATRGWISAADRVRYVGDEFFGLFSFIASGPPPRRLRELLALHRAGIVRFLGPGLTVSLEEGEFVARSAGLTEPVRARAFVEARLPSPDVRAATDPVIRAMLRRGALAAEELYSRDGTPLGGGQLLADGLARAVDADGGAHTHLFLLGPAVFGSAGAGGFARPGFNSPGLRQNDAVARHLIELLGERAAQLPDSVSRPELAALQT